MQYSQLSSGELFDKLASGPAGLTSSEAASRLDTYGLNEISEGKRTPMILRFAANFYHTFALLLWVAGALAFFAGMPELGWAIIAVVVINAIFSFWQEHQAEQAVAALKKLLPARAAVVRDGEIVEIMASELVPGDVLVLREGDNISADARLVDVNQLRVDAATLTGESRPVRKMAMPASAAGLAASEVQNMVLAGTSVAFGSGRAVVFATGMNTEFGKIAAMTQKVKVGLSPLQKEVNRVALIIAGFALALGAALFGLASLLTPLSVTVAAVFAIGMLVANVPEGLLPTVTLSLAMAVKRLVKKNALVKKLSGVETLGSTTVICTDKTGTLTQNRMVVRQLWANGAVIDVGGNGYEPRGDFTREGRSLKDGDQRQLDALFQVAALCNNSRLFETEDEAAGDRWRIVGDPTEAALLVAARKGGFDAASELKVSPRLHELPFESRRKRMSVVHRPHRGVADRFPDDAGGSEAGGKAGGEPLIAYIKGAPGELLAQCDTVLVDGRLEGLMREARQSIEAVIDGMATEGLRVLAFAYRYVPAGTALEVEEVEQHMSFIGLMAMMDPPRAEVADAIERCHEAGIKVTMITGDYGLTAESIARRIGLLDGGAALIVNGADIEAMDDGKLKEAMQKPRVLFARVTPEHKMRIAGAFRELGEVVAMTGDGVNDAPALKRADIGVAMGITGTDVAKEAATIILADDNFATIVNAVEEGRVVFDNMRKFLAYIFAHLTPEVIPFVGYVLFDIPLALTVMQILAIDLGTETLPALALGVEGAEPDIMRRPPRSRKDRLLDRQMFLRAWVYLGIIEAVLVMAGYFWVLLSNGWHYGQQLDASDNLYIKATTVTWAGIVATQIGTAFACRTNRASVFHVGFRKNRWLLWGIVLEVVLMLMIVYLPPLQRVFQTTGLEWRYWLLLLTFPPIIFFSDELRKLVSRSIHAKTGGGGTK